MTKRISLSLIPCLLAGGLVAEDLSERHQQTIKDMISAGTAKGSKFSKGFHQNYFAQWLLDSRVDKKAIDRAAYDRLVEVMAASLEKQVGAAPTTDNSTALAMKGAAPKILGFATERGALTRQTDGTAVTFRATPASLIRTLQSQDIFGTLGFSSTKEVAGVTKTLEPWYDKISMAVTFETSRGGEPNTLRANAQQVSAWSVRAELVNQRNAKRHEYLKLYEKVAQGSVDYLASVKRLTAELGQWQEYLNWFEAGLKRLEVVDEKVAKKELTPEAAVAEATKILMAVMPELDDLKGTPAAVDKALEEFAKSLTPLVEALNANRDFINKGAVFTLDWTVTRDLKAPDISTLTAILDYSPGKMRKHDLTLNIANSFFNSLPKIANAQRYRDFKSTLQYDIPLGKTGNLGPFVLTFAGRFEHIPHTMVAAAAALTAEIGDAKGNTAGGVQMMGMVQEGSIGVGQIKLTIPLATGVKVPLSMTFANRTELITEKKHLGANFGITFDLDAIFAKAAKK